MCSLGNRLAKRWYNAQIVIRQEKLVNYKQARKCIQIKIKIIITKKKKQRTFYELSLYTNTSAKAQSFQCRMNIFLFHFFIATNFIGDNTPTPVYWKIKLQLLVFSTAFKIINFIFVVFSLVMPILIDHI